MHFVRSHVYSNAIDSYILIWPFSDDGDVGYHIDMNIVVIRMSNLGNGTSQKGHDLLSKLPCNKMSVCEK